MTRPLSRLCRIFPACLLAALALLSSCVEPYQPEVINAPNSFLVVDGTINLNGTTTITLSRTQNVSAPPPVPAEAGASITIENESGGAYPLTEQAPGTYTSAALSLNPTLKYRLRLRTAAGREYESDFVAGKATPPIDNVTWKQVVKRVKNKDEYFVQLFVSTHDPANKTHYYRWTYDETWEFQTPNFSSVQYVNGEIVDRREDISHCWASANPTAILLGSSTELSQDVVTNAPLASIPAISPRFRSKYSILVKQYAQTQEEYAYWEKLKTNTESLGTLSDPIPSQLTGNVHSISKADSKAEETVIGYVGATTVTEKRLFIASTEISNISRFQTGYEACGKMDTVLLGNVGSQFGSGAYLPLYSVYDRSYVLIGYTGATAECTDCRRHGTNLKPAFWE